MYQIFNQGEALTASQICIAFAMAVICGIIIAVAYKLSTPMASKNMLVTVIILPAVVQAVIMLVNGSIGTGIAVVGAFSLVRFRSFPGNSRDICILFFAMTAGIATGVGFEIYAVVFTLAISLVMIAAVKLIPDKYSSRTRRLKIHIPENMDYNQLFDDILNEFTKKYELISVKTVSMGTMYELIYTVDFKEKGSEQKMIDKIRCRNGNLTVSCSAIPERFEEL